MSECVIPFSFLAIGFILGYAVWLLSHGADFEKGFDAAWEKHKQDAYDEVAKELQRSILGGAKEDKGDGE